MKVHISPGQRYGQLIVLYEGERRMTPSKPYGMRTAWCICDCGNVTNHKLQSLRNGETKSCGCGREANLAAIAARVTHGLAGHPLYHTWHGILQRCGNPSAKGFRNYGGRGIRVYEEWRDVAKFIAWVEVNLGPRPDGMGIDRADTNGDYVPGNLRWATKSQNNTNQRKKARSTSRFKGVGRRRGRWRARVKIDGKTRYLGLFDDEIAAARAYDAAALELFGPFARLNFPQEAT